MQLPLETILAQSTLADLAGQLEASILERVEEMTEEQALRYLEQNG